MYGISPQYATHAKLRLKDHGLGKEILSLVILSTVPLRLKVFKYLFVQVLSGIIVKYKQKYSCRADTETCGQGEISFYHLLFTSWRVRRCLYGNVYFWKNLKKKTVFFLAMNTPRPPMSVHKNVSPIGPAVGRL